VSATSSPAGPAIGHQRGWWWLALLGLVLVAMVAFGPAVHARAGDLAFNLLCLIQGGLVIAALPLAARMPPRHALAVILGVAVLLRLALLFLPPDLSTDAYRYVWDGRVQGAGINPYRYIPAAPELAWLRDAAIYPLINRADYAVTIYPPAAEMLFFLIGRVADGLVALKLGFFAFEAVTALVLVDLLRRIGQSSTRVLAYLWHPLAIWEVAGSGHIDAAMVAVMLLGIWIVAVLRRPVAGAAVIAVATLMKPLAALALPFAWRPWDWRAPAAAIAVGVVLYLPYLSVGSGMFAFVGGYVHEESLDSGEAFWLVWLLTTLFGPLSWARPLYLAGAVALLGALALRLSFATEESTEARLRRLGWLVFAGLFLLSPGYPWYYLCLVPFAALFGTPAFWVTTIASDLLYDTIPGDPQIPFWIRDATMQIGMIAAFLWSAWHGWRGPVRRPPPIAEQRPLLAAPPPPPTETAAEDSIAMEPTARTMAVAIICKTPIAGKSKTRLSPPLRPEECAAISACFIEDLASTIAGLDPTIAAPYAVYTPRGSEPALRRLLPERCGLVLQAEGDLGDRLHQGIVDLLAAGHPGAILVNSDSPTLPPAILRHAVAALRGGDRLVISPALDGGYTLIGLTRPHRRLFEDIPWSTDAVFELTLQRAREIGLPVVVLDGWYDIDDAHSYAMLEAELDGTRPAFVLPGLPPRDAPATRAFLAHRRARTASAAAQ